MSSSEKEEKWLLPDQLHTLAQISLFKTAFHPKSLMWTDLYAAKQ